MISENDKRLSVTDVMQNAQIVFGFTVLPENEDAAINDLIAMIDKNPPLPAANPGIPCRHGYDDNYWCARCQGKIGENWEQVTP